VTCIAVTRPSGDLFDEGLFVGNATIETLGGKSAEFGFGQIEPTAMLGRVMPFETLDQPPGFGGGKRLVERGLAMDAEIVLDEDDGLGVREVAIGQVFQDMGVVDGGVAVGDLDMPPAFERRDSMNRLAVPLRSYS
jgi:hypothetical protein